MKLVETDAALASEDVPEVARPPRPEHRKAYVSLLVTGAVLVGTVAIVFGLFPKRDHEVIDVVVEHHRNPGIDDMVRPGPEALTAWTIGVLARAVPWPRGGDGVVIEGVQKVEILRRPGALVRYRVGADRVTLVAMVPWDAPPRRIQIDDGAERAIWWRRGAFTMIAVGPAASADTWARALGAK